MPTDILLIDDSVTDDRLLINMMAAQNMRVSVAFDGRRGYQMAVIQNPKLILLDVRMPGQDGFATCRRLKANPTTQCIPIIFLTAANDLEERLTGFALGAVDYIGKPFHEEEVLARIGVHLKLKPVENQDLAETPEPEIATREEVLVTAAQKILQERIADPPSLDELIRLLGTGRRQLNHAFQDKCGQPVFGWLREKRLQKAHHLVCATDMPIALIGEHLGYSTPANFTKAFHERFGFSPRDLRRKIQTMRAGEKENSNAARDFQGA